ncbi:MAG: hypothetical protein ACYCZN_05100 [Candidatus Dormibacteria bacterium]
MATEHTSEPRPEMEAAARGADPSRGMEGEASLEGASLEQALFWQATYSEVLAMEEKVLDRIEQLMADQSPPARREVQLTNVPVVTSQAQRFRDRLGYWDVRVRELQAG